MRSLLVASEYFPPQTGGISRMMEHICLALGPSHVSCLTGVRATQEGGDGLNGVRVYRRPSALMGNKWQTAVPLAYSVSEIILREGLPQVLQLSVCNEGYVGVLLERWLNLPFVIYAHGNEILGAMQSDWDKIHLALKGARCILANSRFTAGLVEKAGVPPGRIRVIPIGCDTEKFRPGEQNFELRRRVLGNRAKSAVILTVGNVVERKGHDMVIRALPAVSKTVPDVVYLIVGAGPYNKELEKLALALGVREQVVFAGRVADGELPSYYGLCDVFAMPSRARLAFCDIEGFGLVFLEAGASGKPSVAGRSGGIEDAVVDGSTGLLVDPSDGEDIEQALIRLLSSQELRNKLGRQGRDRVQRAHTWTAVGKCIREILEQVVAKELDTV